jgi:polyisoprenyl-teichoic acid--peptidoglycan teichoic acid transferase
MGGRRSSRPKKRRAPWWARLSLVFGIVLLVASGGTLAAGAIVLDRVNGSIHQDTLLDSGSRKHNTGSAPTGPIDILLAGSDLRQSWKATGMKPRTDSIMWLHIPASHDRAYLLSIPRDLVVSIPADTHTGYEGGTSRINASFPFGMRNVNDTAGGMQLLSKTLTELTGAHFDMAGLVNWDGFRDITRALGGVTMCLDKGFTSTQPGFTDGPPLTFKAGCHHYDADMALKLVRQRDNLPDGDYGRQKLQQQFIKQILKEATNKGLIANPGKLSQIIDAAGKSITLDLGGYSITNLVLALHNITADKIVTLQVPHHSLGTGTDYQGEALNQPLGDQLFAAMRDDTMNSFVVQHPELINRLPGG